MAINPVNPNMVLDFAQNLGKQQSLTQLGGQIAGAVGQVRGRRAQENYDQLFQAYRENPNRETGLALTQAAIPLGMGQETMLALQMYGQEPPDPTAMSPEQRAAMEARYNTLGQTLPGNYNSTEANEYIQLAERLGYDVEEARQRMQMFRPEDAVDDVVVVAPDYLAEATQAFRDSPRDEDARANFALAVGRAKAEENYDPGITPQEVFDIYDTTGEVPLPPIPESYTTAKDEFWADSLNPATQAKAVDEAQNLIRLGYPESEVASILSQIELFQKAAENNPTEYGEIQSLLQQYENEGKEQFANDADLLAQSIGLDVTNSINRIREGVETRQQQQAMEDYNTELYSILNRMNEGEEIDPTEIARLENLGVNANVADSAQEMSQQLTGIIAEGRTALAQDTLARAAQTLENDPYNQEAIDDYIRSGLFLEEESVVSLMESVRGIQEEQDTDILKAEMGRLGQLGSALDMGRTNEAVSLIDSMIAASDDPEDVQGLQEFKGMVEDGDIEEATSQIGVMLAASGDIGKPILQALQDGREERRKIRSQEFEQDLRLVTEGLDLELTDEQYTQLSNQVANDPEFRDIAGPILNYARRVAEDGEEAIDPEFVTQELNGLRAEFTKASEDWRNVSAAADTVRTAYETARAADADIGGLVTLYDGRRVEVQSGAADIAMLTAFQRAIDDAVVRQSDFENFAGANEMVNRAQLWIDRMIKGDMLPQEQRDTFMAMVTDFEENAKEALARDGYPQINAAFDLLTTGGGSPTQRRAVFGSFLPAEAPEGFEDSEER